MKLTLQSSYMTWPEAAIKDGREDSLMTLKRKERKQTVEKK